MESTCGDFQNLRLALDTSVRPFQRSLQFSAACHPQIQRPSRGILLIATDMADETANEDVAVATIAIGVGNPDWKNAENGNRTNMCRRYVP